MDKDSPRYGSRDDEDSRLFTDEPPERSESRAGDSYGSRRADDEPSASSSGLPRRGGLFSPDRDGPGLPRYDADPVGADHSRDSLTEPPAREGRGFRSGFGRGLEREEPAPTSASSWTSEAGGRDSLLPESSQSRPGRRFSWEKDAPSDPAPQGDGGRDYTAERAGIVSSRLDRLSSGMRQRLSERSYDAERGSPDHSYGDAPPTPDYDSAPHPSYDQPQRPAYDPPEHDAFEQPARDAQGYHNDPRVEDSYIPPEENTRYQGYDEAPYRGAHARELADVDDRYAREYQYDAEDPVGGQADYRDFDDEDYEQFEQPYGDYQPKSRAPFLIIGSLIGVAVIGGGLFYLYQQGAGDSSVREIPVVEPLEGPYKVPAEDPNPGEISSKTKLIYDRIVGEETQSEGNLVPREEAPAALTPNDQSQNTLPAAPGTEEVVPETTKVVTEQIAPEVRDSTSTSSNSSDSALPLPLPPPPAGSEPTQPTQLSQAPQLPTPVPAADTVQPPAAGETLNTGGNIVVPPANEPPAPATEEESVALLQPETAEPALTTTEETPAPSAEPAPQAAPAAPSPLSSSPPLPKQKPVPPSRQAEPGPAVPTGPIQIAPLPGSTARTEAAPQAVAPAPAQPTQVQSTTRRRSASRFSEEIAAPGVAFNSTEANTQVATAPVQQPPLAPAPAPTQQAPVSDGRYLIQLASFRSQEEAQAEFDKLKQRHPSLIGDYASLIQQADLGTRGVYYRLRIGPIDSKQGASKLCNSLIAAGEKDCLVRQR